MIVLQLILFCALFTLMVKLAVRSDALNALYEETTGGKNDYHSSRCRNQR